MSRLDEIAAKYEQRFIGNPMTIGDQFKAAITEFASGEAVASGCEIADMLRAAPRAEAATTNADCVIHDISSRICQHGTKSCVVDHVAAPHDAQDERLIKELMYCHDTPHAVMRLDVLSDAAERLTALAAERDEQKQLVNKTLSQLIAVMESDNNYIAQLKQRAEQAERRAAEMEARANKFDELADRAICSIGSFDSGLQRHYRSLLDDARKP